VWLLNEVSMAQNPLIDSVQALVAWAYLLLTPVLGVLALRQRKTAMGATTSWVILGIWLLVLASSMFLHF
jgi:hypothetical protein